MDDDAELAADNVLDSEQTTATQESQDKPDNQSVLRLLEAGEKVGRKMTCTDSSTGGEVGQ